MRISALSFSGGRWRLLAPMALLALAGCTSLLQKAPPPACPEVNVLAEAATLERYAPGGGRDIIDKIFSARVEPAAIKCKYVDDRAALEVELTVAVALEKGPAPSAAPVSVPYFVAIVDAKRNILAKEVFEIPVTFEEGRRRNVLGDVIEQRIPLPSPDAVGDYRIVLGFQLTRAELETRRRKQQRQ